MQTSVYPSVHELDLCDGPSKEKSNYIISQRRHSSPFPLKFGNPDSSEDSPTDSPILQRRTSIDANSAAYKRQMGAEPRRSERNKRRKSVDKGDFYNFEEDDEEEEFVVVKTPPRNERTKPRKGRKKVRLECVGKDKCVLCQNGPPYYLHKSMNPGWRETLLAVFEYFPKRLTLKEWKLEQQLDNAADDSESHEDVQWLYLPDAYGFLEYHWEILCPPQHRNRTFIGTNWRKTLQDTLSHNRTYFISGKELFGRTGFWRLYERAPSPSHYNNDPSKFNPEPIVPSFFNGTAAPYSIDALFRTPGTEIVQPNYYSNSNGNSLRSSSDDNKKETTDFSELQLLLEAIDCIQRI